MPIIKTEITGTQYKINPQNIKEIEVQGVINESYVFFLGEVFYKVSTNGRTTKFEFSNKLLAPSYRVKPKDIVSFEAE
jgi:hypothetical protein